MAQINETSARVTVELTRVIGQGDNVKITATSYDASGERVRSKLFDGMYPSLSATRQAQVSNILDDAIAYVKGQLGIA